MNMNSVCVDLILFHFMSDSKKRMDVYFEMQTYKKIVTFFLVYQAITIYLTYIMFIFLSWFYCVLIKE